MINRFSGRFVLRLKTQAGETLPFLVHSSTHDNIKLKSPHATGTVIWRSLERYNTEFFGTLLHFLFEPRAAFPLEAISPTRLQHFLWILYPQMIPDLLLCPSYRSSSRLLA